MTKVMPLKETGILNIYIKRNAQKIKIKETIKKKKTAIKKNKNVEVILVGINIEL
jgi:hypothetical protein